MFLTYLLQKQMCLVQCYPFEATCVIRVMFHEDNHRTSVLSSLNIVICRVLSWIIYFLNLLIEHPWND